MRLRRYADDELKKQLEPVEGVAAVKVAGGLEGRRSRWTDRPAEAGPAQPGHRHRDRAPEAPRTSTSPAAASKTAASATWLRTINQFSDIEQMRDLLITPRAARCAGNGAAQEAAEAAARVAALISGSAEALAASASAQNAPPRAAAQCTPGGGHGHPPARHRHGDPGPQGA